VCPNSGKVLADAQKMNAGCQLSMNIESFWIRYGYISRLLVIGILVIVICFVQIWTVTEGLISLLADHILQAFRHRVTM
jgi:hypothetical protein